MKTSPIIVIGMFRSGTSCLSNILSELGFYMGDESDFFPLDEHNQGGYFELKSLMTLNKRLFAMLGMANYRNEPIPEIWPEIPRIAPFVDEISEYIKKSFGGKPHWGLKEPQISGLLPIYHEVFRRTGHEPVYAIAARFPLDVAKSQRTHGPLPMLGERVVGIWVHYTLSSLRETRGKKRVVVKYEQVLREPRAAVEPLVDLAGCTPPPDQWERAIACVNPSWSHSAERDAELAKWPPIVAEVEFLCRTLAADPAGLNAGQYDEEIERIWNDWRRTNRLIKADGAPHGRTIARCLTDRGEVVVEEKYVPTKGWDTVRLVLPIRKSTRVGLDLYQTPGYIYVRRAEWISGNVHTPVQFRTTDNGRLGMFEGLQRIAVLGPVPVEVMSPTSDQDVTIEIEMLVQAESWVSEEIIAQLRSEASRLRSQSAQRFR